MLRYRVDEKKLKQVVAERSWRNLSQFIDEHNLNRATVYHYFKGKGPFSESYYEMCDALGTDPLELLMPTFEEISIENIDELSELVKLILQKFPKLAVCYLGQKPVESEDKKADFVWELGVIKGLDGLSTYDYLGVRGLVEAMNEQVPHKVDLFNLDQATTDFLKNMVAEPIFLGGNNQAWGFFRGLIAGAKRVA